MNYPPGMRRAYAHKLCLWRQQKLKPGDAVVANANHIASERCKQLIRNFEIETEQGVVDSNTGAF